MIYCPKGVGAKTLGPYLPVPIREPLTEIGVLSAAMALVLYWLHFSPNALVLCVPTWLIATRYILSTESIVHGLKNTAGKHGALAWIEGVIDRNVYGYTLWCLHGPETWHVVAWSPADRALPTPMDADVAIGIPLRAPGIPCRVLGTEGCYFAFTSGRVDVSGNPDEPPRVILTAKSKLGTTVKMSPRDALVILARWKHGDDFND
jgi:hypothetical protein